MNVVNFPSPLFEEVRQKISDLVNGRVAADEVADWANQWVLNDGNGVTDAAIRRALDALAGADIEVEPGELLHSEADFRSWLDDLERSMTQLARPALRPRRGGKSFL